MIIVGIDPGLTGAIAMIGHRAELMRPIEDMPVMQRGAGAGAVKNQVNAAALAEYLRAALEGFDTNEVRILIEEAQSMPAAVRAAVSSASSRYALCLLCSFSWISSSTLSFMSSSPFRFACRRRCVYLVPHLFTDAVSLAQRFQRRFV